MAAIYSVDRIWRRQMQLYETSKLIEHRIIDTMATYRLRWLQ